MNGAHWHLVTNHLPIIIPIIGLIVLIAGIILKSDVLKKTAFFIFILASLTAIAAFTTGEEAEEIIERVPGIEERYIETHEDNAKTFATLLHVLGAISLIGIWANWKEKGFSNVINIIALILSSVVIYFGSVTGTSGGEISHPEIRSDYVLPSGNQEND